MNTHGTPHHRSLGRQMPPRSEKHSNFRRLAVSRTEGVLEALRKLSNLSSPNYEFEDAEVERIFDHIQEKMNEARGLFNRNLKNRNKFTL